MNLNEIQTMWVFYVFMVALTIVTGLRVKAGPNKPDNGLPGNKWYSVRKNIDKKQYNLYHLFAKNGVKS